MIKKRSGFTLLEILLAVAALVILAGIVIIAINPTKQLADTRNSERYVDVNTILNGIHQYAIDNDGDLPVSTASNAPICKATVSAGTDNCVSLDALIPTYLVSIPTDPRSATDNITGYEITVSTTTGRVLITAPNAEQDKVIQVTR
jgi:prepilin-type N-terminal cleavage/methylation domain-containing protein